MPRTKATTWKPRTSSLGYYHACGWRAVLDRMVAEGRMDPVPRTGNFAYADLGTCIHFTMQDGMRCVFPGDPSEHAYTDEQFASAATLFNGDAEKCLHQIQRCALRCAGAMPKLDPVNEWHAEMELVGKNAQGHLDFLSDCGTWLVDLKTTTRPPTGKKAKIEHFIQVLGYRNLVEELYGFVPQNGMILYADSLKANWHLPVTFDFHSDELMEFASQILEYTKYLRSVHLERFELPRISPRCGDMYCPYLPMCRDKLLPSAGTMKNDSPEHVMPKAASAMSLDSLSEAFNG